MGTICMLRHNNADSTLGKEIKNIENCIEVHHMIDHCG
jgi:hypothetical protein